jgi:hypothetical protein
MHFSTLFTLASVAAGVAATTTFDAVPSKPKELSLTKVQQDCLSAHNLYLFS